MENAPRDKILAETQKMVHSFLLGNIYCNLKSEIVGNGDIEDGWGKKTGKNCKLDQIFGKIVT